MKRWISLASVLAVVSFGPSTGRAATWSQATTLADDVPVPMSLIAPVVAPDGRVLLAWGWSSSPAPDDHLDRASVIGRGRDGRWGAKRPAPARLLALDSYGASRTIALSIGHRRDEPFDRRHLRVSFGRADGRFQAPLEIAAGAIAVFDARPPVLGVNAGGQALVAWAQRHGLEGFVLRIAERRPGGRFGKPSTLVSNTGPATAVAVSRRGDEAIVFEHEGQVAAMLRRAGRRWGPVQHLGPIDSIGDDASISVTDRGEVRAVWWRRWFDCVNHCEGLGPLVIHSAVARPGDGIFGPTQTLRDGTDSGNPLPPKLLRVPGGWAMGYVTVAPRDQYQPVLRVARGAGAFGPPRAIAPAAADISEMAMAYTSADGLVVGWSQHDPDGNGSGGLLSHLAAVALPLSVQDGQPGAVEVLSQRQVSDPTLAADPRTHHPLAFWTEQRPDPILEQPGSWTARIRMTTRAR